MTSSTIKNLDRNVHHTNTLEAQQNTFSAMEQHHLFALSQYSKAIEQMKRLCLSPSHDDHVSLVASLLVVCFETFHGSYKNACQQIRIAKRIIEEADSKKLLRRQNQLPSTAPPPQEIEEDLRRAFQRLDVTSMPHADLYAAQDTIKLRRCNEEDMIPMPSSFKTLVSARNYFFVIVRRAVQDNYVSYSFQPAQTTHESNEYTISNGTLYLHQNKEGGSYIFEIEKWKRSFQPLYDTAIPGTNEWLATRSMQLHYLTLWLAILYSCNPHECTYDAHLALFQEIVIGARALLRNHAAVFTFDLQTIWPLDMVARKCRDRKVRREAIDLLVRNPRREGIWDSMVVGRCAEWLMKLEEERMRDDGSIPEEGRARRVGLRMELDAEKAFVWCYFLPRVPGLEEVRHEIMLEWTTVATKLAQETISKELLSSG